MNIHIKTLIGAILLNSTLASAEENQISTRVVGGDYVSSASVYPWMVYVQAGDYLCGGTLINEDTVLTAAHCVDGVSASSIFVTVGEYDLTIDTDGEERDITQVYVHNDYDDSTFQNDIALLRLKQNVETDTLARLTLAQTETAVENGSGSGSDTKVIGWGTTEAYAPTDYDSVEHEISNTLLEATVPLRTDAVCTASYENNKTNYDSSTMLCAGFDEGGTDTCQGDSGGPLLYNDNGDWKQVGIVSWGYGCANANSPGVYTRLAVYDDWINNFINGITVDSELDFTDITIDESGIQTLEVSNNSATDITLTFSLEGSSEFSINEDSCVVIAGGTCSIDITYSPTTATKITKATTTSTAVLTIKGGLSDIIITLTGTSRDTEDEATEIESESESESESTSSSSGGGGSSLLFIFAIPVFLLRRFFTK